MGLELNGGRGILGVGVSPANQKAKAEATLGSEAPTQAKKAAAEQFMKHGGTLAELGPLIQGRTDYEKGKIRAAAIKAAPARHPDRLRGDEKASALADARLSSVDALERAGIRTWRARSSAFKYVMKLPVARLTEKQALFRARQQLVSSSGRGDTESEMWDRRASREDAMACAHHALTLQGRTQELQGMVQDRSIERPEAVLALAERGVPQVRGSSEARAHENTDVARTTVRHYRKTESKKVKTWSAGAAPLAALYVVPAVIAISAAVIAARKANARGRLPVRALETALGTKLDGAQAKDLMKVLARNGVFGPEHTARTGMPGFHDRVVVKPLGAVALRQLSGQHPSLGDHKATERLAALLKHLHDEQQG